MKTLLLFLLSAALLLGCETTANKQYWQARADAIADLPQEQQADARIEMLRDWYAQKQVQEQRNRETWTAIGVGLQQAGAQIQQDAALRQQQAIYEMGQCINRVPTTLPPPVY
jgi:hypothetical protein